MKVLFDTNVYISEVLVGGLASEIIPAGILARFRHFVSPYILDETEQVLVEKLGFSKRVALLSRQRIRQRCESVVTPHSKHEVIADPKDSPVLKAAVGSGVDYIVTNDRHLLDLNPYEGIAILTMQDFATLLRDQGLLPPRR